MMKLKKLAAGLLIVCLFISMAFGGVMQAALAAESAPSDVEKTSMENNEPEELLIGRTANSNGEPESFGDGTEAADPAARVSFRGVEPSVKATAGLVPSVPALDPGEDLSNVMNLDDIFYSEITDEAKEALRTNQFFVKYDPDWDGGGGGYSEFYELYEENRYWSKPNFVTVDSLMHTYHLYFSLLMRRVEKEMLAPRLISLSRGMLERSRAQYEALKGTAWENAAKRNVIFFTIGLKLQQPDAAVDAYAEDVVGKELEKIHAASEIAPCLLFEGSDSFYSGTHDEAYMQYRPRGNYEGDAVLEAYFRAMMWYGRMTFLAEDEDATRSALLITMAMDGIVKDDWEPIYAVSAFFAGVSDDCIYYDYKGAANAAWPSGVEASALPGDAAAFEAFRENVGALEPPRINSLASHRGAEQDDSGRGFRFMGQRYNLDGEIYERLTEWNADERLSRIIPDALDVPNAFGSPAAEALMEEQGDAAKPIYRDNLPMLRQEIRETDDSVWSASLYAGWLYTLMPLIEPRPEGYPGFATNETWLLKSLETFEGSYTELKHDTALYAKQAFMGEGDGDDSEERDDRGYVEPEPEVYARFASLANDTKAGLERFGMLSREQASMLEGLISLADSLRVISEKELKNQPLTDDEYDLIRDYGSVIEEYWWAYSQDIYGDEVYAPEMLDASLVADIASGEGWVLQLGTGLAQEIVVLVPIDGQLRVATGSVYSFYEFLTDGSPLTDDEWKTMNGFHYDPEHEDTDPADKPEWTMRYRLYPWPQDY